MGQRYAEANPDPNLHPGCHSAGYSQDLGSPGPLALAVFPRYLAMVLTTAAIALTKRDATSS